MMKMTKYLICVFTIAVLLGGVTTDSLTCLLKQIDPIWHDNFIHEQSDIVCQDIEEKFRLARSELKNCLGFDIDIERLESLYHEFCNPDLDFREKAERQRECLSSHLSEHLRCDSIAQKVIDLINDAVDSTNFNNSMNNICQSYAAELVHCLRESIGGHCGKEGKEVYGRIVEVGEPFIKEACLSAARLGIDGGVPSDDFENKFVYSSTGDSNPISAYTSTVDGNPFSVYTSTVDSDSYAASAVTVHSFTYYLLIGLIFIVN